MIEDCDTDAEYIVRMAENGNASLLKGVVLDILHKTFRRGRGEGVEAMAERWSAWLERESGEPQRSAGSERGTRP